ncbi:MAG: PPC domain-containing DNA-binding protein [Planctomycetota bacterium]|jgi:predicted DNA-binding protein with PD1-like motif
MKTRISLVLSIIIIGSLSCTTQTKPELYSSPAPEVHTITSSFSRIVVVRLKNGTDLLEGLQKAVEKERIKNAVILSGIGSLTDYHVHTVGNRTFPPEGVFMKDDTPEDLLTVTGYVVDSRIHCHITFTDEKRALGGHLEPDTKAFTFAIITIGVLDEPVSLERIDNYTWH